MNEENNRPLVGLQVLVIKDGKVLIGFHKSKDVYGIPGGHWENGETLEEGAKREVLEESGVVCKNLKFVCNFENYREDKKRSYITVSYTADYDSGNIEGNVEEGTVDWQWIVPQEALKLNLFPTCRTLIEILLKENKLQ